MKKELMLGHIPLRWPLMLSPMAGYTNLPFRCAIRSLGGLSVGTSDLVNARSLLEMNPKGIRMIFSSSDDRPVGVQLFGAKKDELKNAARFLENLGIDFIDINMGCPVDKVTCTGAGAALMLDEELTEDLIDTIVSAVTIPVTVKMRLGWDENSINAHLIAPRLEEMGVAAVAVHGRTRAQGYEGKVNLDGIRAVVKSVKKIPVIGNGDVHSPEDARRMIEDVGCSAVMVGRAALKDPFFFRQAAYFLERGEHLPSVPLSIRMLFMHLHYAYACRYWDEEEASIQFRKVISGYSEFYPKREKWRVGMQMLSSKDEYLEVTRNLCPENLPRECREPVLDTGQLRMQINELFEL